jgi:pyridoxine 5-phosphate synthase
MHPRAGGIRGRCGGMNKTILCVNVDHVATVRQARGGTEPDVVRAAIECERNGAAGITVHLREDRRHIQDADVFSLRKIVKGKFNLEMALSKDIIAVARRVKPDQVTIVPEKRQEVTTEGGLDVRKNLKRIGDAVKIFRDLGATISLFIEPDRGVIDATAETCADFIEIHTGTYCNAKGQSARAREIRRIHDAARYAVSLGIRVNAGHGLDYVNVIPVLGASSLEELNIGHSIISRSIFTGIGKAVREMVDIINRGAAG